MRLVSSTRSLLTLVDDHRCRCLEQMALAINNTVCPSPRLHVTRVVSRSVCHRSHASSLCRIALFHVRWNRRYADGHAAHGVHVMVIQLCAFLKNGMSGQDAIPT